jgi:hypothetical protein
MPRHLMGPAGARVVCPTCWLSFIVTATGETTVPRAAPVAPPVTGFTPERVGRSAGPAPPGTPRSAALDGLHALEPGPGSLAGAALRGRLFSEFGPALIAAFDRWREAEGRGAKPTEFRDALEAVTGVALSSRRVPAPLDAGN